MTPAALWQTLPPKVADELLLISDGEAALSRLADRLLSCMGDAPDPLLFGVFADMTLAAWEGAIFSARTAAVVHAVQSQRPFLSPAAAQFSALCANLRPASPEQASRAAEAIQAGDLDTAKKITSRSQASEKGNLFWRYFASILGLRFGELEWYEPWVENLDMPAPFALATRADYAFARGEWTTAAATYARAFSKAALPGWLTRQGESLIRAGEREAGLACWRKVLALRPWQTWLILRLSDMLRGDDLPGAPPAGRGEILLYSWNHGPDLHQALEALAASRLYDCGLSVLDNGSTDSTPEVLKIWRDRLGDRLRLLTFPTNIGAPAARNWLARLESSLAADWVVFLDDDALTPPDWLGLFGAALRRRPESEIVGCRVVDMAAPLAVQSIDMHFHMDLLEKDAAPDLLSHHQDAADFGQFSYLRPAAHVTGCCHLLTRKGLEETGLFDLRFSPSQFDDLERDLRACGQGKLCLYQGHLAVRHIKRSGINRGLSPWQKANVMGNLTKLWASYPNEILKPIAAADMERLRRDLLERLEELKN
ncbi:MAG: glycosyltransferase [Desulfovibrionaceae bacterium]|nr:glycosyltransferase [Desulfovibrionaceae bacterium]